MLVVLTEEFMKYAVEMDSGDMMTIGSVIYVTSRLVTQ
jgi:hypothetical protein